MPLSPPPTDSPEAREHRAEICEQSFEFAQSLLLRFCAPLPREQPFDWCVNNLILDDPDVKGPFDPVGREYLRDPINDNNDDDVREQTLITGTGVGKTLTNIAGIAWKIVHHPCRGLMVMPATKGEGGSETFATSRLIPALEATPITRALMPEGQRRFILNSKRVRFNGAHFGFVGANSSSQIASNRCGDIRMDEADKYKGKLGDEAGTASLVKERVEGVLDYQIFVNTTPTVEGRLGWKNLMRSDFRRRFLPCPHCNSEARNKGTSLTGWLDLAWSEQYCVLPLKFLPGGAFEAGTAIPRAYIQWDKEAKRADGSMDMSRVFRSTRFQCPHCGGHIRDKDKIQMDKNGIWLPLQAGTPHHRGYHLSSLYAPPLFSNENSLLGGRALKFLNAQEDGEGMKGFINSTLAEVDVMQEHGRNKIEFTSTPIAQTDWVPLLTADFHKNWPYVWFVVRKWCAFKLLPPFAMIDGVPDFVSLLSEPGNEIPLAKCVRLLDRPEILKPHPAWPAIAELMRFDSRTGSSPIIDFLLAQNITGEKLLKLYREEAHSNTMDFRKVICEAMAKHAGIEAKIPRGGDSELIAAGHLALSGEYVWDELSDLIRHFKVGAGMSLPSRCVAIDCGYAEKFNREVLRKCYESASEFKFYDPMSRNRPALFYKNPIHNYCLPCPMNGWFAIKGYPMNQRWNHGGIRNELNINLEDPFFGTAKAGESVVEVLELPSGLFWTRKEDLRKKRAKQAYAVSPGVEWFPQIHNTDGSLQLFEGKPASSFKITDYERQTNEQFYNEEKGTVEPKHGKGGSQSRAHPYHLDDCETYQIALATHHEFFEETETK